MPPIFSCIFNFIQCQLLKFSSPKKMVHKQMKEDVALKQTNFVLLHFLQFTMHIVVDRFGSKLSCSQFNQTRKKLPMFFGYKNPILFISAFSFKTAVRQLTNKLVVNKYTMFCWSAPNNFIWTRVCFIVLKVFKDVFLFSLQLS